MEKHLNGNKTLIISHISDADGAGRVILANLAFKNVDYILIEVHEQEEALEFIKNNSYQQIFICDIAMKNEIGDELNKLNLNLLHFDHHQTGEYVNKYDFATVKTTLNNRKTSATELFYQYLINNRLLKSTEAISLFVELVRSYDTWDWKEENNVMASDLSTIFSVLGPITFIENFTESLKKQNVFYFNDQEQLLIDLRNKEIKDYVNACNKSLTIIDFENLKCGLVFSDSYSSQVGDVLCTKNDIDFALLLDMIDNKASLRSRNNVDVSVIARKFGGGGHKNAAGFPLTKEIKLFFLNLLIAKLNDND